MQDASSLAIPLARRIAPIVVLAIAAGAAIGVASGATSPLYVAAAIIGVVAEIWLFLSVQTAFDALIGVMTLLPFGVVPVPLGSVKLTFLDVLLTTLLIIFIGRVLVGRREELRWGVAEGLLIAFLAWSTMAFIIGTSYGSTPETVRLFAKWINSTLLFFVAGSLVQNRAQIERILATLALGGATAGAIGIVLYVLPGATTVRLLSSLQRLGYPSDPSQILQYDVSTHLLRAIGTSINPNIYGALLMICGTITVGLLTIRHPVLPRAVFALALVPTLGALILTYSRGSLTGFAAGVAALVFIRNRRAFYWMLVGLVVAAGIGYAAQVVVVTHFVSGVEAKDKAAAMRLGEYKDAFQLIEQYPIMGVGFSEAPDVNQYIGVSSEYLLLAEEIGLVGVSLYVGTIGLVLVTSLRQAVRCGGDSEGLAIACIAAVVSTLVAGLFDHHFVDLQVQHMVAFVWFLTALSGVATRVSVVANWTERSSWRQTLSEEKTAVRV